MNLERAIKIASEAHKSQFDKTGKPYITHVFRVMEKGKNDLEKICGVLHDVVEDSEWTLAQLRTEGFSDEVIHILELLTHLPQEAYDDYLRRILTHPTAIRIKLNDLEDNMDIRRLTFITEKDTLRLNKYLSAYRLLTETLG